MEGGGIVTRQYARRQQVDDDAGYLGLLDHQARDGELGVDFEDVPLIGASAGTQPCQLVG